MTLAFPKVTDLSEVDGILLIDEVDLHLHPRWQRQLLDTLAKRLPRFQLICTTHSPLTAQQAGPGELVVLERDKKDGIRARRIDADPRTLTLEQIVTSPMFGVPTTASRQVEKQRDRWRKSKVGGGAPSPKLKAQLAALRPADALLHQVRQALKKG